MVPRLLSKPAQSQVPSVTVTRTRDLFNMHRSELFMPYCCTPAQPQLSGGPKIRATHARNDNKKWKDHMEPFLPASHCSRWQTGTEEKYWRGRRGWGDWETNAKPGYDSWQIMLLSSIVTYLLCWWHIKDILNFVLETELRFATTARMTILLE